MQRVNALRRKKVLLFVLDFRRIVESSVHITVAMRVWDTLHGFCCGFT